MFNTSYFVQNCPTCGRRSQIRVEYLGKEVVCQHCHGRFIASDPLSARCDCSDSDSALLRRADELLETVDQQKSQPESPHPR